MVPTKKSTTAKSSESSLSACCQVGKVLFRIHSVRLRKSLYLADQLQSVANIVLFVEETWVEVLYVMLSKTASLVRMGTAAGKLLRFGSSTLSLNSLAQWPLPLLSPVIVISIS